MVRGVSPDRLILMIASACLMTILWLRGTPGLAPKQTADYPAPPVAPLLQSSPSTDDVDSQLSAWRAALNASLAARSVGLLPSAGSVIPPTTTFPPVAPTPPAPQAPIAEAAQLRLHSSAVPSSDAVSASDLFPKLRPARAVPALECPGPRCRVASPQSPSRRARPPAVPAAANLREDSREATKSTPAAALPTSSSGATSEKRRVVFVKTYKTGSTTVAMFLNAVAYQLRLRALHPEEKGWFAIGELKRRARAAIAAGGASPPSATTNGAYFDVSFRHLSPHTEYEPLQQLLPGCLVVSILREPLSRFVSLFNFVGSVRATHKTAEKLVAAVNARNGLISDGDANAFCNNMAWVVSGRPLSQSYAWTDFDGGAPAVAKAWAELRRSLEAKGALMLMSHAMDQSFVLLAHEMGWDLKSIAFKDFTERVQSAKKYKCAPGELCAAAIATCNGVDQALFDHYNADFKARIQKVPHMDAQVAAFRTKWKTGRSRPWALKYPTNCKKQNNGGAPRKRPLDSTFEQVHAC